MKKRFMTNSFSPMNEVQFYAVLSTTLFFYFLIKRFKETQNVAGSNKNVTVISNSFGCKHIK